MTLNSERAACRASAELQADYAALDRRCAELCERARASEWPGLDREWVSFTTSLEARFAYEEDRLFPTFAALAAGRRELVKRLVNEHAAMRQLLGELEQQIRRKRVRPTTVEVFADMLREHGELEEQYIYPWMALDGGGWATRAR